MEILYGVSNCFEVRAMGAVKMQLTEEIQLHRN